MNLEFFMHTNVGLNNDCLENKGREFCSAFLELWKENNGDACIIDPIFRIYFINSWVEVGVTTMSFSL